MENGFSFIFFVVELKSLNEKELDEKMKLQTLEGKIYKDTFELISKNYDEIMKAKPTVSKNSAGYYLWREKMRQTNISYTHQSYDITRLCVHTDI